MDGFQILSLIVATIFLIPCVILLQQFRFTKIKEYLIFSLFFLINFIYEILVAVTSINFDSTYDESYSEKSFILVIQTQLIINLLIWIVFLYLGYTILWPYGNKLVVSGFFTYGLAQLILIASMDLGDIPEKSKLIGITLKSQMSGIGVTTEVFSDFHFGQGHLTISTIWNIACISVFTLSYIRMKNPFNYHNFNKIRSLWLFFAFSLIISQIFILVGLIGNDIFLGIGVLAQLLGIIGIIYVAIDAPEGLLLNQVQLLKAVALFDDLEKKEQTTKFPLSKVFDYIEYMSQHVKNSLDEDTQE